MERAGQRAGAAALLAAALLTGCGGGPAEPGLHFESDLADVGRMIAGPSVALAFPFQNGPEPVRVDEIRTSCGCLEPELWVEGAALPLPATVPPGARGEVRTEFRTEGFSGRKKSGLILRGAGPGLPQELHVDSILDTWLRCEPELVDFGIVDGRSESVQRVLVRGLGPFRLSEPIAGSPGLEVRGAPSAAAAEAQEIEVVLLPSQQEGPQGAFLNLGSDAGWSVRLPVKWETAGLLYVIPHRILPLGSLRAGVATTAAIEVGVREGELDPPEVSVLELEGVRTEVRTLRESGRYQIDLTLPDDLPAGAFSGRVRILLRHRHAGRVEEVERLIRVLGVVQAESP